MDNSKSKGIEIEILEKRARRILEKADSAKNSSWGIYLMDIAIANLLLAILLKIKEKDHAITKR